MGLAGIPGMSGFGVILMLLCDGLIVNAANRNASSILSWQEARGKRGDDLPSNPILFTNIFVPLEHQGLDTL
jgi:hypothetical protein